MSCIQTTYPSQVPVIYGLSQYSSQQGTYVVVNITGDNFVYGSNNTIVYMTNTSTGYKVSIPATYYNTVACSFAVPTTLVTGSYKVVVGVKSTIGSSGSGYSATALLFSNEVGYDVV